MPSPEAIYDAAIRAGETFDQAIADVETACGAEYADELEARIEADPRLAQPR